MRDWKNLEGFLNIYLLCLNICTAHGFNSKYVFTPKNTICFKWTHSFWLKQQIYSFVLFSTLWYHFFPSNFRVSAMSRLTAHLACVRDLSFPCALEIFFKMRSKGKILDNYLIHMLVISVFQGGWMTEKKLKDVWEIGMGIQKSHLFFFFFLI